MRDPERGRPARPLWAGLHRAAWMLATGLAIGLGVVASLFEPELASPFGVFLGGAALALAMVLPFAEHPWERPRRWVELAVGAGVAAVAAQGLASWIGWWTLPVVTTLVATAPWLVDAARGAVEGVNGRRVRAAAGDALEPSAPVGQGLSRRSPETATPAPDMSLFEILLEEVDPQPDDAPPDDVQPDDDAGLRSLDLPQLCGRWQRSFAQLQEASSPQLVLAIAQERDDLLRELTRRDPAGVASWLAADPRVTEDPRRYLRRTQEG